MYGPAPTIPGTPSWGPAITQPWMVSDPAVNQWLECVCSLGTKSFLAKTPPEVRNRVCVSVYTKCLTNPPMNVEAYLNGSINREMKQMAEAEKLQTDQHRFQGGPYGQGAGKQFGVVGPDAFAGRPPASPMANGRPPRPAWVEEAWNMRGNTPLFMRLLARNLPAGALDRIAVLPGQLQCTILVMMLLLDAASGNPVAFLDNCISQYHSFPVRLPSLPSSGSDMDSGASKKLIVLSFGMTTGLEWPAIDVALQLAKTNFNEQFHVAHRCSYVAQNMWKEVFEEVCTNMSGVAPEFLLLEESIAHVEQRGPYWKAAGCTLIAIIHIPKAEASHVAGFSAAPGYHGRKSSSIWTALTALTRLKMCFPQMAVATFQPHGGSKLDHDFFDTLFGKALDLGNLRLPIDPWAMRCQPAHLKPPFVMRPLQAAEMSTDTFHSLLAGAFHDQVSLNVRLPSLGTLETYLDADPGSPDAHLHRAAAELLMRYPRASDAAPVLLCREQLASLLGVKEFKWLESWALRMPCAKYVNTVTGQPTQQGLLESACCGHGRWCPNCCYFYEALTECANPHLVTNGVMVLLQQLAASTPDASLFDVNRLPEHLCTDNCTGFALPV